MRDTSLRHIWVVSFDILCRFYPLKHRLLNYACNEWFWEETVSFISIISESERESRCHCPQGVVGSCSLQSTVATLNSEQAFWVSGKHFTYNLSDWRPSSAGKQAGIRNISNKQSDEFIIQILLQCEINSIPSLFNVCNLVVC